MTDKTDQNLPKGFSRRHGSSTIVDYQDYDGNWRKRLEMSKVFFTDERKNIFLEHFAETGRMQESAEVSGTTAKTVREHMKRDLDFAAAVDIARETYSDKVRKRNSDLYFNPPKKVNYDRNGNIISEEDCIFPLLNAMELKAHCHEYREKQEVNVNHSGGVMLVPGTVSSADEWEKKYGNRQVESSERATDILDITPEPSDE